MKTKLSLIAVSLIMIAVISCKKYKLDTNSANEGYSATPVLPETAYDYTNSTNDHLATLGRVLFYDKSLSMNNSVACASCHQQSKAFCDNLQFSTGLENGKTVRNSPSIFAKSGKMFWDGRANGVEDLVLRPVKNHIEMKFENLASLAKKISTIDYYAPLFQKAFGSTYIDSTGIRAALAEFINNFNFSNNKFRASVENLVQLNASEELGRSVFFGKGRCFNCHHISTEFVSPTATATPGYGSTDMDFNIGLDQVYADNGRGAITGEAFDNGKFMVPVLLNVEYTAPYMHDGRFKTLEEVVEHYSTGIQNHPNLDFELRDFVTFEPVKFNFTSSEKRAIVDFLKTLSDPSIKTEPRFNNPFAVK